MLLALVTSLWFWILFVELCLIVYSVYDDNFAPPIIGLVGGLVILHFFSEIPALQYLKENYADLLLKSAYYIGVGVLWSFVKWYLFLKKEKVKLDDLRKRYIVDLLRNTQKLSNAEIESLKTDKIPETLKKDWKEYYSSRGFPPKSSEHKSKITTWILYWVISMVGTVLGDFLQDILHILQEMLGGFYNRVSNSVFRNIEE